MKTRSGHRLGHEPASRHARIRCALVVGVILAAQALGCSSFRARTGPVACTPAFALEDGWLGGDAVYSVALPDRWVGERRTLWLFGDSYVADPAKPLPTDRVGAAFVHNTIGLSSCRGSEFDIDYVWSTGADGGPRAFIEPTDQEASWYWLFDGFVHRGALYLGLLEVAPAAPDGPLGMPFRLIGMSLARIDDPDAPPERWPVRVVSLSTSREAFPAAAMRVDGDHVLLFAFAASSDDRQPRFLTRLPLAALDRDLDDLGPWLETWTADQVWDRGFLPDRAAILMPDNATEMSVEPHRDAQGTTRLLAVYGSPLQTGPDGQPPVTRSHAVYARRASSPTGPWSDRLPIYEMEEARDLEGGTICYAAKEHPAFARPGELLITYVCNAVAAPGQDAWDALHRLEGDMDLYVPRVIRIPMPDGFPPDGDARSDREAH